MSDFGFLSEKVLAGKDYQQRPANQNAATGILVRWGWLISGQNGQMSSLFWWP
jgi:hypothetical protein